MKRLRLQQEQRQESRQELQQEERLDLDQRLKLIGPQTVAVESDFGVVISSKEGLVDQSQIRRVILVASPSSKRRHSHITFRERMVDTMDIYGEDESLTDDKVTVAAKVDLNEVEEPDKHALLKAETWYTFLPVILGYGLTKEAMEIFFKWSSQALAGISSVSGAIGAIIGGVFGRFIGKNISFSIENAITGLKKKFSEDKEFTLNLAPHTLKKVGITNYDAEKPLLKVARTRLPRNPGEPVNCDYHFGGPDFLSDLLQEAFPDRPKLDISRMELNTLFLTYEPRRRELMRLVDTFQAEYGDKERCTVGCGGHFPLLPTFEKHVLRMKERINFKAELSFNTVVSFNFEEGEEVDLSYCKSPGNRAPCIIVCSTYDKGNETIDYTAHYLPGQYMAQGSQKKRFRLIGGEEYVQMGRYKLSKEGPRKIAQPPDPNAPAD